MLTMFVTLEVSQLSGWLKACASCRVEREGQGARGAHVEHAGHVRDLGRVKAQRLVEGVRVLPSRREGHAMRGEVQAGRREGVERWHRKRGCTGKARVKA